MLLLFFKFVHKHTHTHTHIYIYIILFIKICLSKSFFLFPANKFFIVSFFIVRDLNAAVYYRRYYTYTSIPRLGFARNQNVTDSFWYWNYNTSGYIIFFVTVWFCVNKIYWPSELPVLESATYNCPCEKTFWSQINTNLFKCLPLCFVDCDGKREFYWKL